MLFVRPVVRVVSDVRFTFYKPTRLGRKCGHKMRCTLRLPDGNEGWLVNGCFQGNQEVELEDQATVEVQSICCGLTLLLTYHFLRERIRCIANSEEDGLSACYISAEPKTSPIKFGIVG